MSIVKNILANIKVSRETKAINQSEPRKSSALPEPWDIKFLRSLEWKKFEEVSMEYLL